MSRLINLTGQKFGRLYVQEYSGKSYWKCLCDCGNIKIVNAYNLKTKNTLSCGCLRKEMTGKTGRVYGPSVNRIEYGKASKNILFKTYKDAAKNRNLEFDLSFDEFIKITSDQCYYCGIMPYKKVRNGRKIKFNGDYIYNGIDRVNNLIGYTIENCVSCCETCNRAKLQMSKRDFYNWIQRVYNHSYGDLRKELEVASTQNLDNTGS